MSETYADINLVKGAYDITLFTNQITEGGENQLTVVPIPTTKTDQESGQKETKVVDLLRITNTFHTIAYLTNSGGLNATEIKENLKTMFKGAGISGGPIVLTYDGLTYNVFAQKWVIQKMLESKDIISNVGTTDVAHYMCTLDLVEGEAI